MDAGSDSTRTTRVGQAFFSGWMEGCFDRHFSRINGFRLKGWVDGWMDASQKCMDGYMDDGWMDR